MAQKVTESVKGMDQGMKTVAEVGLDRADAEVGKGLEGGVSRSSVSGGKSGSAEADETVADSALVGEVGSDDTEDADSLGFDDMDSGELTDMENTGGVGLSGKVYGNTARFRGHTCLHLFLSSFTKIDCFREDAKKPFS